MKKLMSVALLLFMPLPVWAASASEWTDYHTCPFPSAFGLESIVFARDPDAAAIPPGAKILSVHGEMSVNTYFGDPYPKVELSVPGGAIIEKILFDESSNITYFSFETEFAGLPAEDLVFWLTMRSDSRGYAGLCILYVNYSIPEPPEVPNPDPAGPARYLLLSRMAVQLESLV